MTYWSRMFLVPSSVDDVSNFWWDPNGSGLSVIGAWLAKGAADYATSLTDLSGNGNNLVEGNGAVPWAAGTGWSFVAASLKWLDTGLVPASDQSWSMFVQFDNAGVVSGAFAGCRTAVGRTFNLSESPGGNLMGYANGGGAGVAPAIASGNIAVAGDNGYRNGILDAAALVAWAGASTVSVAIGAQNRAAPVNYTTSDIIAAAIYNGGVAAVQGQALAIATAMAAL